MPYFLPFHWPKAHHLTLGGGGSPHTKGVGMLVGNFELSETTGIPTPFIYGVPPPSPALDLQESAYK